MQRELKAFSERLGNEAEGYRIRLLLSRYGGVECSGNVCSPPGSLVFTGSGLEDIEPVPVGFAEESTDSMQPSLFHKTTMRECYDTAHQKAVSAGLFDVIFCNERAEVTEGCISNLFIRKNGCFYTPPVTCGLLDGVMRRCLLSRGNAHVIREQVLGKDDIRNADQVYVCNSVRGVLPARLDDY